MRCASGVKCGERPSWWPKTGIKHQERMMIDSSQIVKNGQFPKQQGVRACSPPRTQYTDEINDPHKK